jgi:ATP synthase protein I
MELLVADRDFSTVKMILGCQLLITLLIPVGFFVINELQYGLSFALGGLTAFLPNLYFALRIHWSVGLEAKKIVNAFYTGELGKLIITAALFTIIFQIPSIKIMPLLFGYITALSVFWFALLMR